MALQCQWCESLDVVSELQSVYWELPDGTKAIEVKDTPTIACKDCGIIYQEEIIVKAIEDQLFLVKGADLARVITYQQLMETPRLLKRNYFDFDN